MIPDKYNDIYKGFEVLVYSKNRDKLYGLSCDIRNDLNDITVGHFGYNFWFRLPLSQKRKSYKSIETVWKAIRNECEKYGLTAVAFGKYPFDWLSRSNHIRKSAQDYFNSEFC